MCETLRELFHDELEEHEAKGLALGRTEGSIHTLYKYCSFSITQIAQEVGKPEEFVCEVLREFEE